MYEWAGRDPFGWHKLPSEVVGLPTRNVVLTEHQQKLIEALVESGRCQNASEVLREGLRLVEQREAREAAKLKAVRETAQAGWDDLAAGRYVWVDDPDLYEYQEQLGERAAKRVAAR